MHPSLQVRPYVDAHRERVGGWGMAVGAPRNGEGKGRADAPMDFGVYFLFSRGGYRNQVPAQVNPSDCGPSQAVTGGHDCKGLGTLSPELDKLRAKPIFHISFLFLKLVAGSGARARAPHARLDSRCRLWAVAAGPSTYRDVAADVCLDGSKHWGPEAIWGQNKKRDSDCQLG